MEKKWYERWFGEEYKILYPHRNEDQAHRQVKALARALGLEPDARVLDVGCGSGRHLGAFRALGFSRVCGVDLSRTLLRDIKPVGIASQSDMRSLPFADARFDLLGSFFTSFGYFVTFAEDVAALKEFRRVVKPGGALFLDLHNPEFVKRNLVPHDSRKLCGLQVDQERFLEGDRVVKRIRIASAEGAETHEERVRLFSRPALEPVLAELGLGVENVFGDETGAAFAPESSPRMGFLLRRSNR